MKQKFSFRLGTTSYIIPDNIIPNARYLADKIDDIQLVLFESENISLPSRNDIAELKDIADRNDLTYSIHFPLDTSLGTPGKARADSVRKHIEIIKLTAPLQPSAYIVHFNGDHNEHDCMSPSEDMPRWLSNNRRSVEEIVTETGIAPPELCIETLSYPFSLVEDIVMDLDLSVCLDVGHLVLNGYSVEQHLDQWLDRTRSIHVHGVADGVDHLDLSRLDTKTFDLVHDRIKDRKDLVLTLEVFSENDFNRSLEVIGDLKL